MVEEGIRGGMCHAVHRYAKANNKYMKIIGDQSRRKSSFLQYFDKDGNDKIKKYHTGKVY